MATTPVKPYPGQDGSKKEQVARMFDNISPKYDLLNRVLSFGIDQYWRKVAIGMLRSQKPKHILDVATGTADFAIAALALNPDKVVGVDISAGMLDMGRVKLRDRNLNERIELVQADSARLPFSDQQFDAATVAFGVRNFEVLGDGLADIYRVLRPNGRLIVLEFSKPTLFPVKQLYYLYSRYVLPLIGRSISRDKTAYTYLPESVAAFPEGKDFLDYMERVGYRNLQQKRLTFGICSIYSGQK
jgi:demethylmenaquinone methyltransferase / 2-methoxy-6-polyprenyl-1,4-benzoquinol methylase